MSPPVDFLTVVMLDIAIALGTVSAVFGIEVLRGVRGPSIPRSDSPTPAPPRSEPERQQMPNPFGHSLSEVRAALANFDLIDEIACANGYEPTERERLAHIYAGWALACAAGRAERAYHREVDRGT